MPIILILLLALCSFWTGGCGIADNPGTLFSAGSPNASADSPSPQSPMYLEELLADNPPTSPAAGSAAVSRRH